MFYRSKTYQKVDEIEDTLTYMDVSEKNEPVFNSLKSLLIEATTREGVRDEDTLIRLVTCNKDGAVTESGEECISFVIIISDVHHPKATLRRNISAALVNKLITYT